MVFYILDFTAELENLTNLQQRDGCSDPNYTYYFKVKCENCGEISQKETCVVLSESVPLPNGRGTANLVQKLCGRYMLLNKSSVKVKATSLGSMVNQKNARKSYSEQILMSCKLCGRDGTIQMVPGHGEPLTIERSQAGIRSKLMVFDCRGFEPVNFSFENGWKAESLSGTSFEVDLSEGEFADYDEKGECPVGITNLQASFRVAKKQERAGKTTFV